MKYDPTFSEDFEAGWLMLANMYIGTGKYDIVSTIFKTSNRKITKAKLILRDAKSNFVWARNIVDHDTEENGGTGAFDEMFHKFDTAWNFLKFQTTCNTNEKVRMKRLDRFYL